MIFTLAGLHDSLVAVDSLHGTAVDDVSMPLLCTCMQEYYIVCVLKSVVDLVI